jgi:hypothetical protein
MTGPRPSCIAQDGCQADETERYSSASTQAAQAHDHRQSPFVCNRPEPAEPKLQDHCARHRLAG